MMAKERQNLILEQLRSQKIVNANELAARFDVSIVTIRRDLDHFVSEGIAKRIYGGATLAEPADAPHLSKTIFSGRSVCHPAEKQAIGKAAAQLVRDGQAIFLDSGTTVVELARHLREIQNLTVVTSSLAVLHALADSKAAVYCVGGLMRGPESALFGDISLSVLQGFFFDNAFIGVGGITPDGGMTEFYHETAQLRKAVMARSRQVTLLADSSKFGSTEFSLVGDISTVHRVITDRGLPDTFAEMLRKKGIPFTLAHT